MKKYGYMLIGALLSIIISIGYITFADKSHSSSSINEEYQLQVEEAKIKIIEEKINVAEEDTLILSRSHEKNAVNEQEVVSQYVFLEEKSVLNDEEVNEASIEKLEEEQPVEFEKSSKEEKRLEEKEPERKSEPEQIKELHNNLLNTFEKMEIEIENDDMKIEIEQERKKKKVKSEVEIEIDGEEKKLKNKKADEYLQKLFSSIEIYSSEDLPLIAQTIIEEYKINPNSVKVEIKMKMEDGQEYTYKID